MGAAVAAHRHNPWESIEMSGAASAVERLQDVAERAGAITSDVAEVETGTSWDQVAVDIAAKVRAW